MNLSEAIDMVEKDERALQEKYAKLAEEEQDPFVKVFFARIVKDAKKHEQKLHKKYEKILAALSKKAF
jgi:rubrerythrin